MTAQREITFGEKACGVSFNPGGQANVAAIKTTFAAIIDALNDARTETNNKEVARMYSVAITDAQTAQMWAVKAATWGF
jgi:hypothetical protein